ncbi:TIGR02281 family clan AA aspartic protease [Sphingomonas sp.]|uniref:retropepsin-like aspartic protease family protein n=1 Tax=Sphingomonas sp. TaxID=28214 RepID=UPI00286BE336|nr:TIGR02281 family clan AA aspartic protease [Sphingomonas sp.]
MGRYLLIIMVFMGLFGAMAGRFQPTTGQSSNGDHIARPSAGSSTGPEKRANNSETPAIDGNAVALDRSADGHFYADVEINGTLVHMLVDTGASSVALSRDDARSAGIATSIGMNDVIGEGADGAVHGEGVRIDRMRLGGARADGVDAVVLNSGGMSLLGQDFLQRFSSVEIKDDRMILR